MLISHIHAREIIDSRGNPTVEADVYIEGKMMGRASVPSGASTGSKEAHELRDEGKRFAGKGVKFAVSNINTTIAEHLKGQSIESQCEIDRMLCALDASPNKSRLGANAILAVSMAVVRARSAYLEQPLYITLQKDQAPLMPIPMMNVLNGGAHADNNVDVQEFMIMPVGATNFAGALQMGAETFYCLKKILKDRRLSTAVGDEGGFAPDLNSNQQALDLLLLAIEAAGFKPGKDIVLALDVAASELYRDNKYALASENKQLTSLEMVQYYTQLIQNYPIVSIEDGLHEADFHGWRHLTASLGNKVQLVGDDLFVTNPALLQQGIDESLANAILIKLNQIGTVSETQNAIQLAQKNQYGCIISHRSGETEDTFIADLAVASGCGQIKTGSLCRTDRIAKYNQLLRIEENTALPYASLSSLAVSSYNFENV